MTAAAWALATLTLIICAAYTARTLRGHTGSHGRLACLRRTIAARILKTLLRAAIRYHLTRRRYTRRMHGPLPARDQGIWYDRRRWLEVQDAWEAPAAPTEKSRT